MVGKLLSIDGRRTLTSFTISEDNLFCEGKSFLKQASLRTWPRLQPQVQGIDPL